MNHKHTLTGSHHVATASCEIDHVMTDTQKLVQSGLFADDAGTEGKLCTFPDLNCPC